MDAPKQRVEKDFNAKNALVPPTIIGDLTP